MAEIGQGIGGGAPGSERLPWLEPVEDEDDYGDAGGIGGFAILGLGLLIAIAIVVTAIMVFRHWHAARADIGQIIHAPTTPYKEKPANPGGLKVDGSGAVAARTGTGGDIDAPLDLTALPEQPVAGPGSDRAATPAPGGAAAAPPHAASPPPAQTPPVPTMARPAPVPALPPPAALAPKLAPARSVEKPPAAPVTDTPVTATSPGGSGLIQLGALGSEAKARAVWKSLSSRFAFLAPLTMAITPVKVGDATLYRLRASGGDARGLCARLKIAGETCVVVAG